MWQDWNAESALEATGPHRQPYLYILFLQYYRTTKDHVKTDKNVVKEWVAAYHLSKWTCHFRKHLLHISACLKEIPHQYSSNCFPLHLLSTMNGHCLYAFWMVFQSSIYHLN